MQVKTIAECFSILQYFWPSLSLHLSFTSNFEWPFYTGFTVFLSRKIDFVKAESEDPDKMPCSASFHLGLLCLQKYPFEPPHKISNNVVCATSKASNQPAHMRSLIRARALACYLNVLWVLSYWPNIIWEFLSLKGGYTDLSESTLVKVPQCWKSHVTCHLWFSHGSKKGWTE